MNHRDIQGSLSLSPEGSGKIFGHNSSRKQIGIRDRQRTSKTVTGGPRRGACGIGSNPQLLTVKPEDGPPPGRHGHNVEHLGLKFDSSDLRFVEPLKLSGKAGDIRGGSAHIEADHPLHSNFPCHLGHCDDPSCRTGEQGIFSPKRVGMRQAP
jgi:hypothetical protein